MFNGNSNNKTIWSSIGYWFAEIAVVFIGVYLAFLLSGYRTNRQNEHKKQQIYTSLHKYFASINFGQSANRIDSAYAKPFLKAYDAGKMPRLKPFPFLRSNISSSTWDAMLQAGGIDLLDVKFIIQIDGLFAEVRSFNQTMDNVNKMSAEYLLPYSATDINRYYDPKTKKIRPLYEWYINFLKQAPSSLSNMQAHADSIMAVIDKKMGDNSDR